MIECSCRILVFKYPAKKELLRCKKGNDFNIVLELDMEAFSSRNYLQNLFFKSW